MQFKKVGNNIQVLAYRGYDKEKKRSVIKMIGSIDVLTLNPTDGLIKSTTVDENEELMKYIEQELNVRKFEKRQAAVNTLSAHINNAVHALQYNGIELDDKEALFQSLDNLKKTLRKCKIKRIKKAVDASK